MNDNTRYKKIRQYIGILAAVLAYYMIHEGAHLITALSMGVFKEVKFLGLGMQVDVDATQMTDFQMGVFCLAGAVCTLLAAVLLTFLAPKICQVQNRVVKAVIYYITMIMLLLDPLYLSVLCGFFGGGDMNGIRLLVPEGAARAGFGLLFVINFFVFKSRVYNLYKKAFDNTGKEKTKTAR